MSNPLSTLIFAGMNNVKDPAELDVSTGEAALLANVYATNGGGFRLREGRTSVQSGEFHSGWSNGSRAFVVKGTWLYEFDGTYLSPLANVRAGLPMAYCQVNSLIVASNGADYLIIDQYGASPASPDLNRKITTKSGEESICYKVAPPAGQCLAFYNGRLFIASGGIVYCTDSLTVDTCGMGKMIVDAYDGTVTALLPVDDGIYVGTTTEINFLSGPDPFAEGGFIKKRVAGYGIIYGTGVITDAAKVPRLEIPGTVAVFATPQGVCYGGNGGVFRNESLGVVSYQYGESGAAAMVENDGLTHYVVSLPTTYDARNRYEPPVFDVETTGTDL